MKGSVEPHRLWTNWNSIGTFAFGKHLRFNKG